MNRNLLLVRHSVPEIHEDRPAREWQLSEEGRRRAGRLAERLLHEQLEIIITSPEAKAKETAEILAGRLVLPMQAIDNLHEHERGSAPFLTRSGFEATIREYFETPDTLVFGNETADQSHERFSRSVYSIITENDNSKKCCCRPRDGDLTIRLTADWGVWI